MFDFSPGLRDMILTLMIDLLLMCLVRCSLGMSMKELLMLLMLGEEDFGGRVRSLRLTGGRVRMFAMFGVPTSVKKVATKSSKMF